MFRAVGLSLAMLLCAAACGSRSVGSAKPIATAAVSVDAHEELRGRIEQWRQAYEVRSFEALAELYAQDLDVAVTRQGRPYRGWSATSAYLEKLLGDAEAIRIVVKDVALQQLGESAVVASAWVEFNISADSTTTTERGEMTLVFHERNDEWLIVAEHYSYPTRNSSQ